MKGPEKTPGRSFQTFADPERLSLDSLSFVGDTVYTLFFRLNTLSKAHRRARFQHDIVTEHVSARGQRKALEVLIPLLTDEGEKPCKKGLQLQGGKKHGTMRITEWPPRWKPW